MDKDVKQLFDMRLHESFQFTANVANRANITYTVTRVIGGWIYYRLSTSSGSALTFVPENR